MKMYTRRALSWVLAIALLITCGISGLVLPGSAEQSAGATELFPNGNFEDGAVAPWANFAADSTHWAIGDGYGVDGSRGMKWIWEGKSVDSTVYAKFDEAITITEPGTYRFSFSSTVTGTTGIKVTLHSLSGATFVNKTGYTITSKSTVDHKGEWTTYHADFVVTEETVALAAEEGLSILVKTGDVNAYIGDDLSFDNFSLKKWDESQGLIMDGDFDNAVDATFFGTHASTSYKLSWLTNATNATIVAHPNGEVGNRVLKLISGPRYMGDASYFVKDQSYLVKFDYSGAAFQLYEGTGGEFVSLTETGRTMNLPRTAENEWKTYAAIYTPAGSNAMRSPLGFTGVQGDVYIDNFAIYNYTGPDTLEMSESAVALDPAATKDLSVVAKAYGVQVVAPAEITWETSDAAVATVADGVVTAVAPGKATITAKAGELTATCEVTVQEGASTPTLSGIALNKTTASVKTGTTVTLTVTGTPADAVLPTIEWTTSDAATATVANGVVTGVKTGNATITAKAGDFTATCEVTVTEDSSEVPADDNIIINGDFEQGASVSWNNSAFVKDGVGVDGSVGLELQTVVDETTTQEKKASQYYKDALIKKLQPDTVYELSFDVKHEGKGKGELYLNMNFGTVEGTTKSFSKGQSLGSGDFDWKHMSYVFFTPSTALSASKGYELMFRQIHSADSVGTGTLWIDNVKIVKVRDVVHVDELVLDPAVLELLPKGTGSVKAMTVPEGASTGILTYTSSNPEVVTVDNTGKVTALVDNGEATITVTNDKGKTATAKVVVTEYADIIKNGDFEQGGINWNDTPRVVSGVGKDGSWGLQMLNPTAGKNSTIYYKGSLSAMKPGTTYILTYDYFTTKGSKWRIWSGNLGFSGATHTAESTGWTTKTYIFKTPNDLALSKGYDFGFVSEEQGSEAPSVVDNVTLRKYTTGVDAESIRLSPETLTLIPGRTGKLALHAVPDNADLNDTKYTSSNHNVAIVEDGVVTAVGNGTATITAITKNGKTATCVVTVSGDPALIKNGTFDIEGDNSWILEGGAEIIADQGSLGTAGATVSKGGTISQKITGLKPNTPYTLSMKFRTKSSSAGKANIKIVSGDTVLFEGATGTGTSLKKTSFEFTTPENIGSEATVIFTPAAAGPVYFDNVSLTVKASLVDFVVTDMYWIGGNQQVKPGTELKFGVTVTNQGQDAVKKGQTIVVELRKNGQAFMTLEHTLDEDLASGGSTLVTSTEVWKAEKGNWVLSVRANPTLSILEIKDTNNTMQKDLRVNDEILVAPDQALQFGMTDLTFSDEFDGLETIDQYATGRDGYKWYVTRQWGSSTIKPDDYSIKDGVISLISKQPGYHVTLSTMDVNTGIGYTWNKGYLEVRMRIPIADPGKSNVDYDGSPAIWSFPDTKWLETSGKNKAWVEMDWLEYWGVTDSRPGGYYTITFHDQRTESHEIGKRWFSNKNAFKEGLGDEQWHTMGWMWTENLVIAYVDGVQVFKMSFNENEFPSCSVDTHDSVNHDTTGAFTLMNELFNVLFISGSEKFPLELDYVRIWQSSTGNVIVPDSGNDGEEEDEEESAPVDVSANDFWWYYGADDYGDLITEITEENYEIILAGGELWDRLSEERQKEIDALFVANGQPAFTELYAEAQKFAANLGDDEEGEAEGDGEGDAPEAEKPAGTGATTALPAALATVMFVSTAVLWVSRKRKREQE